MQSIEKIVLIGSGNVATQLSGIFIEANLIIIQVYSSHIEHAKELAAVIDCEATDSLQNIYKDADLYIIAIKDDAIAEINKELRLPGKMVVHTSGAVELEAIKQVSDKTGVFYPLQTFTKEKKVNWQTVPIIIEGSDTVTTATLKQFAGKITGTVIEIDSANRKKIHVAAVFANNFINSLLGEAKEILGDNIPFHILESLVRETIEKAFDKGAEASQTGPARRQDMHTIESHLKLLDSLPDAQNIYRVITESIIRKYGRQGTND